MCAPVVAIIHPDAEESTCEHKCSHHYAICILVSIFGEQGVLLRQVVQPNPSHHREVKVKSYVRCEFHVLR